MKQLIPALLAALCLLLASCGTSPAATLPMGTDETPVESEASESTGPWAPTGEQMQKENAVTDLLNESGEGYSYRIPQLNCQTQDAELINTAISDELMPLVDEAHTAQAQGYGPTCVEIGWESHWCGDVLVLLTHSSYPNDCAYHQVYCFERITGTRLTNAQILDLCGVTQAEFEAGAADAAERCFRSIYPDTMGGDALWQEQLEWTRSAENVNDDMMMYPDENGKLMLLSPIGSLAGASYYEHSYPFAG